VKAAAGTADERIDGGRVSLHRLREADLATIDAWYEEAAGAAYEDRAFQELRRQVDAESAGLLAIERADEDEAIGLLEYVVRDAWLTVPFIALTKVYRGWGYGSEAVRLVEEWAVHERLATRSRAEVDRRNGLGVYFWLRLGYRPAGQGELDSPPDGGRDMMPMVRTPNPDS